MNYIIFDRESADPAKAQINKSKQDGQYGVSMWAGAQRPSALLSHQPLGVVLIPRMEGKAMALIFKT